MDDTFIVSFCADLRPVRLKEARRAALALLARGQAASAVQRRDLPIALTRKR